MSRRITISLGLIGVFGLATAGVLTVAARPHVVSEAVSPDGSWGVAVLGRASQPAAPHLAER